MSNGAACCVLEICCYDPVAQANAVVEEFNHDSVARSSSSERQQALRDMAEWLVANYDLAPKGSLVEFKQAIKAHVEKKLKA